MSIKKCCFIFSAILLLSSCVTTTEMKVEIFEPAKITFSQPKAKLLLVDRTHNPAQAEINITVKTETAQKSTPISLNGNSYVYEKIKSHPYFSEIRYFKLDSLTDTHGPELNVRCLKTLRDSVGEDFYIFSLDSVYLKNTLEYIPDGNLYLSVSPELNLRYTYHFFKPDESVSTPFRHENREVGNPHYIDQAHLKSTINYDQLRNVIQGMSEQIADALVPYIIGVDRYYIKSPHLLMKEASAYMQQNEFDKARIMWKYAAQNVKSKKTQAIAWYNIALCDELNDDFESAKENLDKALKILREQPIRYEVYIESFTDYLQKIEKRIADRPILNLQLGDGVGMDSL